MPDSITLLCGYSAAHNHDAHTHVQRSVADSLVEGLIQSERRLAQRGAESLPASAHPML